MFERVAVHREKRTGPHLFSHQDAFRCFVYRENAWASTWVTQDFLEDFIHDRPFVFASLEQDLADKLSEYL